MDRRTFIKLQASGLLWATVGGPSFFPMIKPAFADSRPDIAVAKGSPAVATRKAVDAIGGINRFVKPGNKVIIKPNMSFAHKPENGSNTHPEVVREILIMCKEAGASKIRVLDHSLQDPEEALNLSGIRDACDSIEKGICHHLMASRFYNDAEIKNGKEMKVNAFMRDVLESDVIIAVPVAKSHGSTGVSLSLKGQMGLVYDRRSMHSRYNLDVSIVDLCTLAKPTLSVIDATRVLTTKGPGGPGEIITPGEVIASADPVAADAMAVASYRWYGRQIQPRQVGHIREAHERGLGRMDIENLRIERIVL